MDPPDESSFEVPVQRVTRQRRASHPSASDFLSAHRDEMFRTLDAFEHEWALPLMARRLSPNQPSQRRFSTPDLLLSNFLEDSWPPLQSPFAPIRGAGAAANAKTVEIEWLDDEVPPHPRIEDVTSSSDPEFVNSSHRQNVCVVEMPSAVDPHRDSNSHAPGINPHAPVITDVSTDIAED